MKDFLKWLCLFSSYMASAQSSLESWAQKERKVPDWYSTDGDVRDFYLKLKSLDPQLKQPKQGYLAFLKIEKAKHIEHHPLLTYIYEELLDRFQSDKKLSNIIDEKWFREKKITPPTARWILDKISNRLFLIKEKRKANILFKIAKTDEIFFNKLYKELKNVLTGRDHHLFFEYGFQKLMEEEKTQLVFKPGHCQEAQRQLEHKLKMFKNVKEQEKLFSVAEKIGVCFGPKKQEFWSKILPLFTKELQPNIHLKLATLMWNKELYQESITEVQKAQKGTALDEALYLEGRIHDSHQEAQKALDCYRKIIHKPSKLSAYVLRSMILLEAKHNIWSNVTSLGEKSADFEKKMNLDPSFGLFWQARGEQNLEKKTALLQELMTDYHSTFYGAMAHRMLELQEKKDIPLPTKKNGDFNPQIFKTQLSEKEKHMFDLVRTLILTGNTQDAILEVKSIKSNHPLVTYGKSLLLYVAREWLESILMYNSLSREQRNKLPFESEKIVFPLNYSDLIGEYTKRLSLDEDLVLALIRQESVFNPKALSGANAQGLMQMLRSTALEEMKRIHSDSLYLSRQEREFLTHYLKKSQNLFEPKPNVMIGVHHLKTLLSEYSNIVFALAAYNAGPTPLERWKQKYPQEDLLIFIESIPYRETREYVKVILRNYFYYKKYYHNSESKNFVYMEDVLNQLTF